MSNLPYGLAPTHLTGQQAYDLWNAESPDRYKNLSKLSKAKWDGLANWINERATASVDVSDRVDELQGGSKYPLPFRLSSDPDGVCGVNIHDDDLAAAAMRFYKEFGPKPEPVAKEFPKPKEPQGVTKKPEISLVEVIYAAAMLLKAVLK